MTLELTTSLKQNELFTADHGIYKKPKELLVRTTAVFISSAQLCLAEYIYSRDKLTFRYVLFIQNIEVIFHGRDFFRNVIQLTEPKSFLFGKNNGFDINLFQD